MAHSLFFSCMRMEIEAVTTFSDCLTHLWLWQLLFLIQSLCCRRYMIGGCDMSGHNTWQCKTGRNLYGFARKDMQVFVVMRVQIVWLHKDSLANTENGYNSYTADSQ